MRAAALRVRSWQTGDVNARVTLSGELSGEHVVDEIFEDGRIVLRPPLHEGGGDPQRAGVEPVTDDEFGRAFGQPSER